MPANADVPAALVDTSVAVALVVVDHEHHAATARALRGRRLALAGHAAFETFSVLTRLPPPTRRAPKLVRKVIEGNFASTRWLGPSAAARLFAELPVRGISGGSVYDALVGATAVEHGLPLVTRDARALDTYSALDVELEMLL
jgi:predicted nucleic acid-binding protein